MRSQATHFPPTEPFKVQFSAICLQLLRASLTNCPTYVALNNSKTSPGLKVYFSPNEIAR